MVYTVARWFVCTQRAIEQWGYLCTSEILMESSLNSHANANAGTGQAQQQKQQDNFDFIHFLSLIYLNLIDVICSFLDYGLLPPQSKLRERNN